MKDKRAFFVNFQMQFYVGDFNNQRKEVFHVKRHYNWLAYKGLTSISLKHCLGYLSFRKIANSISKLFLLGSDSIKEFQNFH